MKNQASNTPGRRTGRIIELFEDHEGAFPIKDRRRYAVEPGGVGRYGASLAATPRPCFQLPSHDTVDNHVCDIYPKRQLSHTRTEAVAQGLKERSF